VHSSLKLFLIGLAVSFFSILIPRIGEIQEIWDNPGNFYLKSIVVTSVSWTLIYATATIISATVLAIEPLKKRLTPKQYMPFSFMAGNGVGFVIMQIISTVAKIII
jgi:hypothetical protein